MTEKISVYEVEKSVKINGDINIPFGTHIEVTFVPSSEDPTIQRAVLSWHQEGKERIVKIPIETFNTLSGFKGIEMGNIVGKLKRISRD